MDGVVLVPDAETREPRSKIGITGRGEGEPTARVGRDAVFRIQVGALALEFALVGVGAVATLQRPRAAGVAFCVGDHPGVGASGAAVCENGAVGFHVGERRLERLARFVPPMNDATPVLE